jgi:hypothetical protein
MIVLDERPKDWPFLDWFDPAEFRKNRNLWPFSEIEHALNFIGIRPSESKSFDVNIGFLEERQGISAQIGKTNEKGRYYIGIDQFTHFKILLVCFGLAGYGRALSEFKQQIYVSDNQRSDAELRPTTTLHLGEGAQNITKLIKTLRNEDLERFNALSLSALFGFIFLLMHEISHAAGGHFKFYENCDLNKKRYAESLADINAFLHVRMIAIMFPEEVKKFHTFKSNLQPGEKKSEKLRYAEAAGRLAGFGIAAITLTQETQDQLQRKMYFSSTERLSLMLRPLFGRCANKQRGDKDFNPLLYCAGEGMVAGAAEAYKAWDSIGSERRQEPLFENMMKLQKPCFECQSVGLHLATLWNQFDETIKTAGIERDTESGILGLDADSAGHLRNIADTEKFL